MAVMKAMQLDNASEEGEVMNKPVKESWAQVRAEQNTRTRERGKTYRCRYCRCGRGAVAAGGGATLRAQGLDNDKYSLTSPGGIAFSDFRGYEDWSVVSSARTEEVLKVIVANPAMIKAYKAGSSGKRPAFSAGLNDRETPMEAEEKHGSAFRSRCARCL